MPGWLHLSLQVGTLLVMLSGLFSLVLIVVPGLVIIWAAALLFGLAAGFHGAGWAIFGLITLLAIFGSLVDNLLMGAKARQSGAGWPSIAAALVAGLAGSLLLPPFGGILFALAAIFLIEYLRLNDWRAALSSTKGMALGCGWAFAARFAIGLAMIAAWAVWAFALD